VKPELDRLAREGWITTAKQDDLTIYNYSNRAVFEKMWNEFTLAARGLVLRDTGEIVARPWKKFFNLGEIVDHQLPSETPELAKKYDGSLLIVFHDGSMWRCCTRGCWDNYQCQFGNEWIGKNSQKLE